MINNFYIYEIYQTDNRRYVFMPFDYAMKHDFKRNDYKFCYKNIVEASCINEALNKLWIWHNADDRPASKTMRSLSMSDVVTLDGIPYYCDRFDWSEIPAERWYR